MTRRIVTISRARGNVSNILRKDVKESDLHGKQRIFVKPNLSHPEYVRGVVTDPKLVFELVSMLRDFAEEVIVGESDGFNYSCRQAFEQTGMATAVRKAGGTVANLSEDKVVKVKFESNLAVRQLFLPKTVMDVDAFVNLPMMKTHEFVRYSGAIKNLFGCVPSNKRIYLHPYLTEVFVQLYTLLRPQLTIMDARVGIEGNGPTKGNPVEMNLILSSNCTLATDIIATRIMGLDWKETYLNYIAQKTGFLEETVKVHGLQIANVAINFKPPKIDLPVKAQMKIYRHEFLTKILFCSLDIVKLFQKITTAYRGSALQTA